MREVLINLPDAGQVQRFVSILSDLQGDFELFDGSRILDARSLMGIFSFDLTKPLKLRIYHDSRETLEAIRAFTAETEHER